MHLLKRVYPVEALSIFLTYTYKRKPPKVLMLEVARKRLDQKEILLLATATAKGIVALPVNAIVAAYTNSA